MHQHIEVCSRQIPVNGGKLGELSPPLLDCIVQHLLMVKSHRWAAHNHSLQSEARLSFSYFLHRHLRAQAHLGGHVECGVSFLDGHVGVGRDKCGLGKSLYEYHSFGIDFNEIGHTNHTNG